MKKKKITAAVAASIAAAGILIAAAWAQMPHRGESSLSDVIEAPTNVFAPSLTEDGKTMVFNSKKPNELYYDIYVSYYENDGWTVPALLADVNSPFNDETPFITPDGTTLLFSSDREEAIRPPVTSNGFKRVTFDIFLSIKTNGKWSAPVPISGEINTIDNERTPSMSKDKRTVYFSRWPFKAPEQSKIMSATLSGSRYIKATPLPAVINAGYLEVAPVPAFDGSGLYFSSKRPGGYGEWDVYFSPIADGNFETPVNMNAVINSSGNDLFLNIFPDKIFLCSDRNNAAGRYSIISFKKDALNAADFTDFTVHKIKDKGIPADLPPKESELNIPKTDEQSEGDANDKSEKQTVWITNASDGNIHLNIIVTEEFTGNPTSAVVRLTYRDSNNGLIKIEERACREDGILRLTPQAATATVTAEVSKPGFMTAVRVYPVYAGQLKEAVIGLKSEQKAEPAEKLANAEPYSEPQDIAPPKPVENKPKPAPTNKYAHAKFEPVPFAKGSAYVRIDCYKIIYKAIDFLYDNPNATVTVKAYPDATGSRDARLALSRKRAASVKAFITERGIADSRVKIASATSGDLASRVNTGLAVITAK